MKLVRKILFWSHLVAGVSAGLVILVMSATGVLLAFEKQIVAFADRGFRSSPPAANAPSLGPEKLLPSLLAARADAIPTSMTFRRAADAPVAVGLPKGRVVYLDAYDAHVLGEGSTSVRGFFDAVTDLHRWLALSGEGRKTARLVTGVSNLVFLFIVLSGLYLWMPRVWTKVSVRAITWFRGGLQGRARDFNWHNTIGIWCAIPLAVVVVSAVPISFTWGSDLVLRLAGEEPQKRPTQTANAGGASRGPAQPDPAAWRGLDAAIAKARLQDPEWRALTVRLAGSAQAPLVVNVDSGTGGQPQKRGQLTVDRDTGEVTKWAPFSAGSAGRRARGWLRFLHTGEALGLLGQLVAGVASLGGTVLVWTGIALALRRLARKLSKAEAPAVFSGTEDPQLRL
ncbi:MAG: PepSY domain-containing protein [Acidobacteria bacterium]|nr:PepSY domain-containing protein [Acidobacteriota bacterium]